jgi:AraC-like DNA-binding protein
MQRNQGLGSDIAGVLPGALGMTPKRYLLLRRMAFVRRALRAAVPDAATVTDVATRYGFWQLGRFTVEYRSLFGGTPPATLHGQPD